jgi:hypothetical protein
MLNLVGHKVITEPENADVQQELCRTLRTKFKGQCAISAGLTAIPQKRQIQITSEFTCVCVCVCFACDCTYYLLHETRTERHGLYRETHSYCDTLSVGQFIVNS